MRIAYLFIAHTNPTLLAKAIRTLSTPDSMFFIHIDKKASLEQFTAVVGGPQVAYCTDRVAVYWGGFSVVRATLNVLRQACSLDGQFDYCVLLSGSDYPLHSGAYIREFLRQRQGDQFMSLVPMPNLAAGQPMTKVTKWWVEPDRPLVRLTARALGKVGLGHRDYNKYLPTLRPYAGDMWWA